MQLSNHQQVQCSPHAALGQFTLFCEDILPLWINSAFLPLERLLKSTVAMTDCARRSSTSLRNGLSTRSPCSLTLPATKSNMPLGTELHRKRRALADALSDWLYRSDHYKDEDWCQGGNTKHWRVRNETLIIFGLMILYVRKCTLLSILTHSKIHSANEGSSV